jgi:hypothetical protein
VIVLDFFNNVNDAYRGTDDDAPTIGTTDGNEWLRITNRLKNDWALDEKVDWRSLFATRTLSPVVAVGTQSYNLPADFLNAANEVLITSTGGTIVEYALIDPSERRNCDPRSCFITGPKGGTQVLTFVDTFNTGDITIGGTISIDGYFKPADLTASTDVIPVDDPNWLIFAVAAELAFNELTYQDKAPDIQAKANVKYTQMVQSNRRGSNRNPRRVRTLVNRIPGSRK